MIKKKMKIIIYKWSRYETKRYILDFGIIGSIDQFDVEALLLDLDRRVGLRMCTTRPGHAKSIKEM